MLRIRTEADVQRPTSKAHSNLHVISQWIDSTLHNYTVAKHSSEKGQEKNYSQSAAAATATAAAPKLAAPAAAAPMPAPAAEAAPMLMEATLAPTPVAPAAAPPTAASPAPMPVTAAGMAPPIATLWAVAKRLPATTLPIPACAPAAIVPTLFVW